MSDRFKILYVDDEADITAIVALSLRLDPMIDLRTALSGADALALIDAGNWKPDLAMIDMLMPDMTGMELIAALRQLANARDIPVLFVTASAQPADVRLYLDEGAIGVIGKPFDPIVLAPLVRRHFAEYARRQGDMKG